MSIYIYSSHAISTLGNSLGNNLLESMLPFEQNKELVEPVYKEFIHPMLLRRMGKATKMSIVCSLECLQKLDNASPNAIIVGTGLGAIADTEKFLKISSPDGDNMLPPTSFIQSGHNTIAGQIALLLKNDKYNMTHVQQGLSFEYALQDALLTVQEGAELTLVGAVDENTPLLKELAKKLNLEQTVLNQLSEGAAFFTVGTSKPNAIAKIKAVSTISFENIASSVLKMLNQLGLDFKDISKGFIGYNFACDKIEELPFETINYTDYTGRFFASSAVGMHLATHYLQYSESQPQYSLVVNVASKDKLGLIIVERV